MKLCSRCTLTMGKTQELKDDLKIRMVHQHRAFTIVI